MLPAFLFAYKFAFAEFIVLDNPALDVKGALMLSSELCKIKRKQVLPTLLFVVFVAVFASACCCAVMLLVRLFANFNKLYFLLFGASFALPVALFVFFGLFQKNYQSAKQSVAFKNNYDF